MAIKLDMSKVYDRVEWSFLNRMMQNLGFYQRWIQLVVECVKTPYFLILINGALHGFISPSRGIRQGDPLSPYLFLLCAEGFSSLLRKAQWEKMGYPFVEGDQSSLICYLQMIACFMKQSQESVTSFYRF